MDHHRQQPRPEAAARILARTRQRRRRRTASRPAVHHRKDVLRVKPSDWLDWLSEQGVDRVEEGRAAALKDAGLVQKVYALPAVERYEEGKSFGLYTGTVPTGTAQAAAPGGARKRWSPTLNPGFGTTATAAPRRPFCGAGAVPRPCHCGRPWRIRGRTERHRRTYRARGLRRLGGTLDRGRRLTGMDEETRATLQQLVGGELGLPTPVHKRIGGDSVSTMRSDAAALATELGLTPAQQRDGQGRFAGDMNSRIRQAAGRA